MQYQGLTISELFTTVADAERSSTQTGAGLDTGSPLGQCEGYRIIHETHYGACDGAEIPCPNTATVHDINAGENLCVACYLHRCED